MPVRNRAPIEEGVKAEEILDRMLEGEMKVTPKELWAVAPKLRAALKEILTSKRSNKERTRLKKRKTTSYKRKWCWLMVWRAQKSDRKPLR